MRRSFIDPECRQRKQSDRYRQGKACVTPNVVGGWRLIFEGSVRQVRGIINIPIMRQWVAQFHETLKIFDVGVDDDPPAQASFEGNRKFDPWRQLFPVNSEFQV